MSTKKTKAAIAGLDQDTQKKLQQGVEFLKELHKQYHTGTPEHPIPLHTIARQATGSKVKTNVHTILLLLEKWYDNDPMTMVSSPKYLPYFSSTVPTLPSLTQYRIKVEKSNKRSLTKAETEYDSDEDNEIDNVLEEGNPMVGHSSIDTIQPSTGSSSNSGPSTVSSSAKRKRIAAPHSPHREPVELKEPSSADHPTLWKIWCLLRCT